MLHNQHFDEVSYVSRLSGQASGRASKLINLVIETHTKNVRFCILCNYVNKITPAIQSRCTRFRFSPLPEKEVQRKVDEVVEKEGYVPFRGPDVRL